MQAKGAVERIKEGMECALRIKRHEHTHTHIQYIYSKLKTKTLSKNLSV